MSDVYAVGQRVLVFSNYRKSGPSDGIVEKVGRTLVHVRVDRDNVVAFRMDTGIANDGYGHSRIKTEAQAAADARRSEVLDELKERGIRFDFTGRDRIPLAVLEGFIGVLNEHGSAKVGAA